MSEDVGPPDEVLEDPALIPGMITEGHRKHRGSSPGLSALLDYATVTLYKKRYSEGDDGVWHSMLDNGLTQALLACALDKHFCGYTKDELTIWPDDPTPYVEDTLAYIVAVMRGMAALCTVLSLYCVRRPGTLRNQLAIKDMAMLLCNSRRIWEALWDIRTPFLDSQALLERGESREAGHETTMWWKVIIRLFAQFILTYEETNLGRHPGLSLPASRLPHVMLTLWIREDEPTECPKALDLFRRATTRELPRLGDGLWLSLYRECVADTQAERALQKCVLRDYRAKSDLAVRETLFTLVTITSLLRQSPSSEVDMADIPTRKILFASLAGWRTLLCAFGKENISLDNFLIDVAFGSELRYLASCILSRYKTPELFPERHVLGIVLLMGLFLPLVIAKEDSTSYKYMDSLMDISCRFLRHHRAEAPPDPSPKLRKLRRHAAQSWHAVMRSLDDRSVVKPASALWRQGRRGWALLKGPLEVAKYEDAEDEASVSTLELCALPRCECHHHRPLHLMRVCTGCHVVAYCNTKCQIRDWGERHRYVCRGRRCAA